MNRRGFLGGLIAAPAIVAASNIMPVRSIERLSRQLVSPLFKIRWYEIGDIFKGDDGTPYRVVETGHYFEHGNFSAHVGVRSLLDPSILRSWNVNYRSAA